tara:strand:+ start:448 stop:1008 length:561 start_codon:yes stop_codon:yes gene_type:complete
MSYDTESEDDMEAQMNELLEEAFKDQTGCYDGDEGIFYISHNLSTYAIPIACESDPVGVVRCYAESVEVNDGDELDLIVSYDKDAWTAVAEKIIPRHVVIVQGKLDEDDKALCFFWFTTFVFPENPCKDQFTLRQIPKHVYKILYKNFMEHVDFKRSSVMDMLPRFENDKSMSPIVNGFDKVTVAP